MKTSGETDYAERHGRHDSDEKVFTMIARVGVEVICIGYVYKPNRRQMDEVVAAVKELGPRVPRLNVSLLYEFAVERSLREYRESPGDFERDLRKYLRIRRPRNDH